MKIITLTGASACGKDTLLKRLLKEYPSLKPVITLTTRPPREGEINGVDYNFTTDEEFKNEFDNLIEHREYNTVNGKWFYGMHKNSIDINSDDIYVCILDVLGVQRLSQYIEKVDGNAEIISIFLECSGRERLLRSLNRETNLNDDQVAELCRRYIADLNEVLSHKDVFKIVLKNENDNDVNKCITLIDKLIK